MGRFSDKVKIVYLTLVILFAMGVFVYLMDVWGIIRLEETFPFMEKTPPAVAKDHDSPTLLDRERLKIKAERLEDLEAKLKEREKKAEEKENQLKKRAEDLAAREKGVSERIKRLEEQKAQETRRRKLIESMAARITSMPPDDAVAIVLGWNNADVVDVFKQMEKTAQEAGRPSIVPFLLTKLPRSRAQIITSLMLDSEAGKLPKDDLSQ